MEVGEERQSDFALPPAVLLVEDESPEQLLVDAVPVALRLAVQGVGLSPEPDGQITLVVAGTSAGAQISVRRGRAGGVRVFVDGAADTLLGGRSDAFFANLQNAPAPSAADVIIGRHDAATVWEL